MYPRIVVLTHLGYSAFWFSLHPFLSGLQVIFLITKGFIMTENNKPEWFEIAEKDQPSAPRQASKTLPLAAVLAATLIIGVGAVLAQIQEEPPATAIETTSTQTVAANSSTPSASTAPVATPSVNPTAITTPHLQNPSIAQLPTKRGGDDDEGRSGHGDDEGDDEGEDD